MIINVHAGHNPHGCVACGCVGYLSESQENRKVKDLLISALREVGNTVYDCTVNDGTSQSDVLQKIVAKCNAHNADLDLSIHFNASDNPNSCGVECWVYSKNSKAMKYAQAIESRISDLGFKSRGVKVNSGFYVLRKTKAPAIIIECCFATSKRDSELFESVDMANAIFAGITGQIYDKYLFGEPQDENDTTDASEPVNNDIIQNTTNDTKWYRVSILNQKGAFHDYGKALNLQKELENKGYKSIITE